MILDKNYISFRKYRRIGERLLMMRSNSPPSFFSLYTKVLDDYQFDYVFGVEKLPTVR
jgi:hypothetical protein